MRVRRRRQINSDAYAIARYVFHIRIYWKKQRPYGLRGFSVKSVREKGEEKNLSVSPAASFSRTPSSTRTEQHFRRRLCTYGIFVKRHPTEKRSEENKRETKKKKTKTKTSKRIIYKYYTSALHRNYSLVSDDNFSFYGYARVKAAFLYSFFLLFSLSLSLFS